ncbi:unnamed protein product [Auanema sp. JU1783]|nr:unnamed protein product [Auanema sp. JU1783]
MEITSRALVYNKYGDPREVLNLTTQEISTKLKPGEVLIHWLATPINPLDINRIQGRYATKADLPAIGGSEGVGEIVKVAAHSKFTIGDHVTLFSNYTPFWCDYVIADESELYKINKKIDLITAATLMINPPTAWIMLKEFVHLVQGDYVIQNSANSGVGRNVIQLCKAWGIKTINLIRSRRDVERLKTELWRIGADHVFTEEEFSLLGMKLINELKNKPRLALNGVGGRSVLTISSALAKNGICIVYGGMSKKTHEFSTASLVFNNIQVRGVNVGLWMRENRYSNQEPNTFEICMKELQILALEGKITAPPVDVASLDKYRDSIVKTMAGGKKQLLMLDSKKSKL